MKDYLFQPGNPGKPFKYESPEELEAAIEEYFTKCDDEKRPYTISGLALACGLANRSSLLNYEKKEGYEAFHQIVTKAKARVEARNEEKLVTPGQPTVGLIFNLKNNFKGWHDKQEIETTSKDTIDFSKLSTEEKIKLRELLSKANG